MKTKNEIYVVVDTPKKAKKLQKVLDMFGEKPNEQAKENGDVWRNTYFYFEQKGTYDTAIYEQGYHTKGKQKVSIKELRNILAVEHLKEGDFVVCRNKEEQVEHLFEIYDKDENTVWYQKRHSNEDGLITLYGSWSLNNFIRYATEEERLLLDPKEENKELEVGKWYILDKDSEVWAGRPTVNGILCYKGDSISFGFNMYGEWWDNFKLNESYPILREATQVEIEHALVKECVKRGFADGAKIKDCNDVEFNLRYGRIVYSDKMNKLYYNGCTLFSNGKWAEVLPQTDTNPQITDHDIATLERLHDTLHDVHGYSLEFELMKSARVLAEKLRELNAKIK